MTKSKPRGDAASKAERDELRELADSLERIASSARRAADVGDVVTVAEYTARAEATLRVWTGAREADGAPYVDARWIMVTGVRHYCACDVDSREGATRVASVIAGLWPAVADLMTDDRIEAIAKAIETSRPGRISWQALADAWRGIDAEIPVTTWRVEWTRWARTNGHKW